MYISQKKIKSAALFFIISSFLSAQEALKSTEEEYYDFLSLTGAAERPTLNYRTLSDSEWTVTDDEKNIWKSNNLGTKRVFKKSSDENENWFTSGIDQDIKLKIYGPEWFNSYNSAAPYGQNDGALWQGKGYNTSITAGARLEAYGFEMTVKPQVTFSENREFDFMPGVYGSEYSYFWKGNIDLVQRYGDSPYWQYDWGDTEARWTWRTFTAGFGFQSPWLGPAWLNPMLGSNNAGTYPKFDIGFRKTEIYMPWTHWYLGKIEGRTWMGQLAESDYFDNDSSNDSRQITGISVSYSPSFLPELTLSINKISISRWDEKSAKYLNPFYDSNKTEDMKCSFGADMLFPSVGFEVYGELGLDDHNSKSISNPFHTAIYTVGAKKELSALQKINFLRTNKIRSEIIFEFNNFEMSQDFQLQWHYMGFYAHGLIAQGYTQRGQILGAGSGYFGTSVFLAVKTYFKKGNVTLFLHYDRPDSNYLNNKGIDTKESDWRDEGLDQYEDWGQYKARKIYGITASYFLTKSLMLGGEFNTAWTRKPNYKKIGHSYRNNYFSLLVKYNF